MGKRRTNAPHKDRYTGGGDSESEEEEEQPFEPEPLEDDQIAQIKTRKKLIAKRRGPAETTSFGAFGALRSQGDNENSNDDTDKPSVFSGFKGFSAFKPSAAAPVSTKFTSEKTPVTSSLFSTTATSLIDNTKKTTTPSITSSLFAPKMDITKVTTRETAKPNLFSQVSNGEHIINSIGDNITKTSTNVNNKPDQSSNDESTSNNISETELNFINELNDVYEKYYGKTKRVLKLPSEVLNQDDMEGSGDKPEEEYLRKKYGFLLAELNKHCSKWISKHVEEDPLIVLTPIFVDYFNYMILMEKNFYPNTFKNNNKTSLSALNGISALKSNNNGIGNSLTSTTLPVLSFNSSSNILFNKNGDDSHKMNINGHKDEDKENEEAENDKKLSESSKNFANLGKTNQMINPISLTGSGGMTTAFTFKPTSESPKLAEKDSNSNTPAQQTSLFKFNAEAPKSNTQSLFGSSATTTPTETKTPSSEEPKPSFKAPGSTELNKVTPTFKFGASKANSDTTPKTASTPKSTESTSIFGSKATGSLFGSKITDSQSTSLFGKVTSEASPAAAMTTSSLFGKKTESSSIFGKPVESESSPAFKPTLASSIFKTDSPSPATNMFSSLAKPAASSEPTQTKDKSPETTKPAAAPSFSSLMSASANQNTGSTFKGFAGFGNANTGSPFSGLSNSASTETTSTDKPATATPFFSFAGAAHAAAKPGGGLFGAGTTGSSLFGAGGTFPAATGGQQEEEEEYVPPIPETSDVKEEGAVYEKRMKLYYYNEKESKFVDRGIGNLYIKPINNGESTSLVIRADNKLANILLNVKLSKSSPISKIGPKDVSFLCVPNPPIPGVEEKKPCKFLFKVKSEEFALELVEKLNKNKK